MTNPIETPEETARRLENVEVMLADDNERLRGQWQPIETAPKGGMDFLMGWPEYATEMAMWDCESKQFVRSVWQRGETPMDEHTPDPLEVDGAVWMPAPQATA